MLQTISTYQKKTRVQHGKYDSKYRLNNGQTNLKP